ncbi:pyridoxal phosphate-dependent aminotransferase [Bradyrhizobium sp. SZCCHNR2035]|uniref:pyridoxal phosphate-dependent aminotransferase n=1 Tax=Bradyrhizobium sp. SZCCHNR2035 TaxID=3057386 RepID=UPI002915D7E6|nr:pyridoxal phosphate-dependent aminotransferase [Bradyrhizobium sp. SZCCHNR2035]
MEPYSFDKIASEANFHERNRPASLARLSDWNTRLCDVSTPLKMYAEAFARTLETLTTYPDAEQTKELCEQIKLALHNRSIAIQDLYLYGSATQAINMLFFALSKHYPRARFIFLNPGYFSVKTSAEAFGLTQETLYRLSKDRFSIPLDRVESVRNKYANDPFGKVCAVMITEPTYSSGVRQSTESLRNIASYCSEHGLLLIIDGAFSGLIWGHEPQWLDADLLSLLTDEHVVLVDSIAKNLFFLNTKIGVLYGPPWLIDIATKGAGQLAGNITALQQQLALSVFSQSYLEDVRRVCQDNIERFKKRFGHLEQLAADTPYRLLRPESGYHTMAVRTDCTIGNADVVTWSRNLISKGIYPLPGHAFGYSADDNFCFRISLAKQHDDLHFKTVFQQPIR